VISQPVKIFALIIEGQGERNNRCDQLQTEGIETRGPKYRADCPPPDPVAQRMRVGRLCARPCGRDSDLCRERLPTRLHLTLDRLRQSCLIQPGANVAPIECM